MSVSKTRLDQALTSRGLVQSRSQAESYIKLGYVTVDGTVQTKPGALVGATAKLHITVPEQYVSRAGLKLASVASVFNLDFRQKTVLDVGSSTGGFTDFALKHGAKRVIAVELGKDQLHTSLRSNPSIDLHEQTDIRDFKTNETIDIVVADVSFMSLRLLLPHIATLCTKITQLVLMVKPQFEAVNANLKHKGVIKNERVRRQILDDFERWCKTRFVVINKADSQVFGAQGNQERFYLVKKLS